MSKKANKRSKVSAVMVATLALAMTPLVGLLVSALVLSAVVGGAISAAQRSGNEISARTVETAGGDVEMIRLANFHGGQSAIQWEFLASIHEAQKSAYVGVGPFAIDEGASKQVPAPGATDLDASMAWVAMKLADVARQHGIDTRTSLVNGVELPDDGMQTILWNNEEAHRTRVDEWVSVVAELSLSGADETWARIIVDRAERWMLGMQASCSAMGPNYAMINVEPGSWVNPTIDADGVVGSPFGMRFHPILRIWRPHNGIDLTNSAGTPIWSVAAGTVIGVRFTSGGGNIIEIDHGGGVSSVYLHLLTGSTAVSVGQQVAPATQIAKMGSTGLSTTPHLHFEIRINGKPVDPVPFLAQRGVNAAATTAPGSGTPAKADPLSATTPSTPGGASESPNNPSSLRSRTSTGLSVELNAVQIDNAALIIGIAKGMGLDQALTKVALMAALQESSLRNLASRAVPASLNYPNDAVAAGDHDSVGIFQQRALQGTWGTVAQIMDPVYSTKMFFGGPNKPKLNGPRGLLDVIAADPNLLSKGFGYAAQKVQVSAYPDAYDKWAPVADDLLAAVTGTLVAGSGGACGGPGVGQVLEDGAPVQQSNRLDSTSESFTRLSETAKTTYRLVAAIYPAITSVGGWRANSKVATSDHPAGKAIDIMISDYKSPAQIALGDRIAAFLTANHQALGIKYVMWRQKQWTVANPTWRPMADRGSDNDNHYNHVHVSFSS